MISTKKNGLRSEAHSFSLFSTTIYSGLTPPFTSADYSVLITLFVFILSNVLLKNQLPIDKTDAISIFISLVVLTGYIYVTRSALRLSLIFLYTVVAFPFDLISHFIENKSKIKGLRGILFHVFESIGSTYRIRLRGPLFVVREWSPGSVKKYFRPAFFILGVFDRIILICVSFVATLTSFQSYVQLIGTFGITLLLLIFIFTGRFSFVLYDAMHKAEKDNEDWQEAQLTTIANSRTDFPSVITTRPETRYDP